MHEPGMKHLDFGPRFKILLPAAVTVIRECAEWDGADLNQRRILSQKLLLWHFQKWWIV